MKRLGANPKHGQSGAERTTHAIIHPSGADRRVITDQQLNAQKSGAAIAVAVDMHDSADRASSMAVKLLRPATALLTGRREQSKLGTRGGGPGDEEVGHGLMVPSEGVYGVARSGVAGESHNTIATGF